MRRAAIYARYSTDLQSDRSIDDQVALCRGWCAREGVVVVGVHADRARSSASRHGRPGLMEAVEAARAGQVDMIVTEALDRISRSQEDLAWVYNRVRFAGAELRAVHDGQADVIQIGLRGIMGEMFLADLKHKIRRGMAGVVREGRNAGGKAYGYRPVSGKPGALEIVPHEAAVVRRIHEAYLAGQSPRTIAGALNADGILPPRGARWNASTLTGSAARGYGILRNPLYAGRIVWNRIHMVRDPETGRRVSRDNPPTEWQEVAAPDLAIVPGEVFAGVQERLAARGGALRYKPTRVRRIFSGLLRCGCCGAGIAIQRTAGTKVWGRCARWAESRTCENRTSVRIDRIEEAVLAGLADELRDPVYIRAYVAEYHAARQSEAATRRRDQAGLDRAAAQAQAAYDRAHDLYVRGVTDGPEAEARLRALLDATRAAKTAAAAEPPEGPITLHPAAARRYIEALADFGAAMGAEAAQRLRELVAEVIVTPADRGHTVSVKGHIAALMAAAAPATSRGVVVAEARFGHPPTLTLLNIAV